MTQQHFLFGTVPNDGTGDTIRAAFLKAEANFTELYGDVGNLPLANIAGDGATNGQVPIWNGTDWVPGNAPGGAAGLTITEYPITSSGTLTLNTNLSVIDLYILDATTVLNVTIPTPIAGKHVWVKRKTAAGAAHIVTGNFDTAANTPMTLMSPYGGETLQLWGSGTTTWRIVGFLDPGVDAPDLAAANAPSRSDVRTTTQGGFDKQTTLGSDSDFINTDSLPALALGATVTLGTAHSRLNLYTTTALAMTVPAASALTPNLRGYAACLYTLHTVTITGTLYDFYGALGTAGAAVSSIPPNKKVEFAVWAGTVQAMITPGATGTVSPPLLQISTITGQTPGGTSTAQGTYANGAPSTITATLDGSALSISGLSIVNTGGSGASAYGTFSFNFTTPVTGTHNIVASSTGTYATASNSYSLTTASGPILAITGVTPTGAGLVNAVISGTFANGAPTGVTIVDSANGNASITVSGFATSGVTGSGATAAGNWSATITNPAAGNHTLVATGTGTYAATSSGYSYTTAAATLTVNSISAPSPNTAFAVSGTYSSSTWTPAAVQYSVDGGSTWITPSAAATISGGNYSFNTNAGLAVGGPYTVKVRGNPNNQIVGTSNSFSISASGSYPDLGTTNNAKRIIYDATVGVTSSSGNVSAVVDQGANGVNATVTAGVTTSTLNSLAALTMAGSTQSANSGLRSSASWISSNLTTPEITVALVFKTGGTLSNTILWQVSKADDNAANNDDMFIYYNSSGTLQSVRRQGSQVIQNVIAYTGGTFGGIACADALTTNTLYKLVVKFSRSAASSKAWLNNATSTPTVIAGNSNFTDTFSGSPTLVLGVGQNPSTTGTNFASADAGFSGILPECHTIAAAISDALCGSYGTYFGRWG